MSIDISMLKTLFLVKGHQVLDRSWKGQTPDEEYTRLYYVVDGEAEMWHHGTHFKLSPKHLYLVPMHSRMKHRCRGRCEIIWVHFSISIFGHVDLFASRNYSYMWQCNDAERTKEMMLELISIQERDDMFSQLRARSLLYELVACFFRFHPKELAEENQDRLARLVPVLDYINNHLGERIEMATLAGIASYEKTYFSALFKDIFKVPPSRYIQQRRIEEARSMLRNSGVKIAVIASDLGFVDAYHFSKTFKRLTGESPSAFRRRTPQVVP